MAIEIREVGLVTVPRGGHVEIGHLVLGDVDNIDAGAAVLIGKLFLVFLFPFGIQTKSYGEENQTSQNDGDRRPDGPSVR